VGPQILYRKVRGIDSKGDAIASSEYDRRSRAKKSDVQSRLAAHETISVLLFIYQHPAQPSHRVLHFHNRVQRLVAPRRYFLRRCDPA
jgi:hypothetical protein